MPDNFPNRREMSLRAKLSIPEAAAPPWSLSRAGLCLLAMFVCLLLIGPTLASLLLGSVDATPGLLMLGWALGMALCIAFALLWLRGSPAYQPALQFERGHLPLPNALLLGVAIAIFIDLVISLGSGQFLPLPEVYGMRAGGIDRLLLGALLLILLQPLAETLVFQAILLPSLRWRFGPWRGVVGAVAAYVLLHTLVFTLAYTATYDPLWYGRIYPAGISLAFCLLKVYAQSSRAVLIGRVGAGILFFLTALVLTG